MFVVSFVKSAYQFVVFCQGQTPCDVADEEMLNYLEELEENQEPPVSCSITLTLILMKQSKFLHKLPITLVSVVEALELL